MASMLFSPLQLRSLTLANRIVVSSMCQYSAENGNATDWHLMHIGSLAAGSPGLFITEATAVEARGRISPEDLGLYSDENEQALRRVLTSVRRHVPSVPIGMQIAHAGRKASTFAPWRGHGAVDPANGGWSVIAPSAEPFSPTYPMPREMTRADMVVVRDAFAATAARAARIGIDLIELHAAHGYLLHEFYSPLSNHRTDEYGGSLENRLRFPLEVAAAVRETFPSDKPVGARITGTDWIDGGFRVEDAVELAKALKRVGYDYVCVSSGAVVPKAPIPVGPGYQVPLAERVKAGAGITTFAVGMITTPQQAEEIVSTGKADATAIARAYLDDPHWPWHAAQVLGGQVQYPPQYERAQPKMWSPKGVAAAKAR
jgi:2,4-dienoyl-CoA reductase-like NADH-dependent reductase (Old Yellow Enzyme family)